jgi:hypothetical protein
LLLKGNPTICCMNRNVLLIVSFVLFSSVVTAQKKVILEGIRYATNINYLQEENHRKLFLRYLNASLVKHQQLTLKDSARLILLDMNRSSVRETAGFSAGDTSDLHLIIDVAEYPAGIFFNAIARRTDSAVKNGAKTVFRVGMQFSGYDKKVISDTRMDVIVSSSQSTGMGYESSDLFIMPRAYVEMMRTAMDLLADPQSTAERIAVKVAPVYCTDNFIQHRIAGVPRIVPAETKGVTTFIYQGKRQLLRLDSALYEEIIWKGRKALTYPPEIMDAIKNTSNTAASDFVFLRQEARDVLYNKNYLVKLIVQVDPEIPVVLPELLFTNFLPGNLHLLLSDNDTIAKFSIESNLPSDIKVFPGRGYNGIDSTSAFIIAENKPIWQVLNNYTLKGKLKSRDFTVTCSGKKGVVKTIYLDNQLVCIAQGKQKPEIFVVFDASLSPEILNQLLIIGFNRFLE